MPVKNREFFSKGKNTKEATTKKDTDCNHHGKQWYFLIIQTVVAVAIIPHTRKRTFGLPKELSQTINNHKCLPMFTLE